MKQFDIIYQTLITHGYFTEEELQLVCEINGSSLQTLQDCIFARYGVYEIEDIR